MAMFCNFIIFADRHMSGSYLIDPRLRHFKFFEGIALSLVIET